ncbi:MAG TPA: hypothetical protein VEH56_01665 [Candidatus Saccharimonadales bacterium]|nr:hypothetical protein [Candidatus Saccharimonadales bacterium]
MLNGAPKIIMGYSLPRYDPSEKNTGGDDSSNTVGYQSKNEGRCPKIYFKYYSCNDKRPEK